MRLDLYSDATITLATRLSYLHTTLDALDAEIARPMKDASRRTKLELARGIVRSEIVVIECALADETARAVVL